MKTVENNTSPLTLDRFDAKQTVVVAELQGGWGIRQRLNQMGIHVEDELEVRRCCSMGGPILVRVHGTEIALGLGLARKIRVRPVE